MILLDAYALMAVFREEPAADSVEQLLRTEVCSINVVNLAETIDRLVRFQDAPLDLLEQGVLSLLETVPIAVVEIGKSEAIEAGLLRGRYYRRGSRAVSLADCMLIASALRSGSEIATGDPALTRVAEEEGLVVHHLA